MRPEPGSPADWLKFAESDFAVAKARNIQGVLLATLCFHAQQAVEKALKAVLIYFGRPIVRTHSIEALIRLTCEEVEMPTDLMSSADLSAYAVGARYPGVEEPITEQEYTEAIEIAESVLKWAQQVIGPNGCSFDANSTDA